ncbi:MAG: hypothetical protein IPG71_00820 [bacterium]|nr:hypothetical protein [bacterium]
MDLPASTYYYCSRTAEDRLTRRLDLQDRIETLAFHKAGYGYRRITAELRRQV